MATNQRASTDSALRAALLSGAVVTLATLIGAERFVAHQALGCLHKTGPVAVRTLGAPAATRLSPATGLGWTAATVLLLLFLRRSPLPSGCGTDRPRAPLRAGRREPPLLLHSTHAISYRAGGLYGG